MYCPQKCVCFKEHQQRSVCLKKFFRILPGLAQTLHMMDDPRPDRRVAEESEGLSHFHQPVTAAHLFFHRLQSEAPWLGPISSNTHTHIKQHLSVNKRGSSNGPWRRESWRTSKALMWSDGRGPRRDGILPSTSNWQEKERKQEEGSEIKKINIAELIAKRGMTRHNKVKRMMGERWSLSVLLCLAFTLKMIQHGEHMDVNYISLNGDTF